jgi:succinoglycan biosynthesis transport protein ExoP
MDKSHKTKPTSGSASGYIVNSLTHAVNPVREAAKQQMIDAQAMMLADNAQLSVLDRAVANSDSDMAATPDKYMRLGDLKNDSTVYQKLYDDLRAQLVQLNARRPADQSYATMLQLPTVPKVPASPRIVLYTTVATVLGALLGVVLIFMLDTFDPTVRDPADIALLADIPVLQSLPYHPENGHSPKNEQISQQSYQRLASTLSYSGLGTRLKTLMLTSANSSEGSSEVAAKLAAALAKAGRRIILVDATGVEPRIVPIGNQKNDEYISDSAGPGSSDSSLPVKSSETPALNVSALLESSDTEALVRQLKLDADVVIFDAPAIFEGVNTAVLAEQVDAVLFISKLEGMTRDEIRQALGLILSGPAPVLGVVLNDKRL